MTRHSNISTISFFSKKTKMENGEIISEEGGFYLEKTSDSKKLCYKKKNFSASLIVSKKTFQRLKSITSGVILEKASVDNLSPSCGNKTYERDYLDEYDSIYGDKYERYRRSSYQSQAITTPKVIAPFIHQEFIPL